MLVHRKNWCRVCGTCLTCPRTNKSLFQHGSCNCIERQINHIHPDKVKGDMLFSFRYRHLSAEDIDILCELRPRFLFDTPPIERDLVRANICSTCQQRLRRARLSKQRRCQSTEIGQPIVARAPIQLNKDSPKGSNVCEAMDIAESQQRYGLHQTNLSRSYWNSGVGAPRLHDSAVRSTLQLAPHATSRMTCTPVRFLQNNNIDKDKSTSTGPITAFQISNMLEPGRSSILPPENYNTVNVPHSSSSFTGSIKPEWRAPSSTCISTSALQKSTIGHPMNAQQVHSGSQNDKQKHTPKTLNNTAPNSQPPGSSNECVEGDPDKTHVDLDIAENSMENCSAKPLSLLLPLPRSLSRPVSPPPVLPPPYMLLPALQNRAVQGGCLYAENRGRDIGDSLSAQR